MPIPQKEILCVRSFESNAKQSNKWDPLNLVKQYTCDEPLLLPSGQSQQKRENKRNQKFLKNMKFIPGAPTNLDCKVYPLNHKELNWMIKRIGEELDMGYIKEGNSLIVSPTFTIPKKQPGQFRMVVDYCKVNDMTVKDHYTMANVETKLGKLKSKKIFIKFDI